MPKSLRQLKDMPDTEASGSRSITFTSNFPIPSPMNTRDIVNNWEFFKQQWNNYEVATGLETQSDKVRLAMFRSVMGKDCLQIFSNLKLSKEERNSVNSCLNALEAYTSNQKETLCTSDIYLIRVRRMSRSLWMDTSTALDNMLRHVSSEH